MRNDATPGSDDTSYPITRHRGAEAIVAVRGQRPIRLAQFLDDVADLAARLPPHRYLVNRCTDRYRFMVGLAASLCRGQITLLAPGDAPATTRAIAETYPDLAALTDSDIAADQPPVHARTCPERPADHLARDIPVVPGRQIALILFTSGSTGQPKPVPKSWGALVRSAWAAGDRLGLAGDAGNAATLIGTVPHHHSYGLESTILLGLQHGLAVDAGMPFYPGDVRAAIGAAARPRILVTAPVHLRALVAEPDSMPPVDLILSATAPLPHALAAQAEACFAAPLVEIYGCTEAGQLATRRTVQDSDWLCLPGVALDQRNDGLWASGAAVQGLAPVHDIIEPTGTGRFRLAGRSADLVDVAGKRTSLGHLNHQLLTIAGVQDGVFLMAATEGQRVARLMALVVAPQLAAEALLRELRGRIDAAFLPRPLIFVDHLPRNHLGKLSRETLLALAGRGRSA